MGISIRNLFYSEKRNITKAITSIGDYDEFLIFVVDHPYRLSLEAFNNMEKEKAEDVALREGINLKKFLYSITKSFNKVKISSWKELEDQNYDTLLLAVKNLERNDKEFSKLIQGEFTETITSKIQNDNNKRQLSKNFIMEEITMFASLVYRGYTTRISKYSRSKSLDYFLKSKYLSVNHIQL